MDEATVADVKPRPPAEAPLLFGKRYRPLALLGSGGMGSVYLARDEELAELVAVKVLRPELLDDPKMLDRFRDEVRLARRVSSPLVARTHDLAEHEGRWFVTMQYVEGETLSAKLRREGHLSLGDIVPIARDVCDGLSAVHAAGVVHRDLKPGNVLLAKSGHAVLTDFGIALSTDSALTRTDGYGTPTYTAPEQLAGEAVDARADIFSMGAMLYAMITGQKPFTDRTGKEPPPDPRRQAVDVPDSFAALVMRAMATDARDRFASTEAFRAALETVRPTDKVCARKSLLPAFIRTLVADVARKVWLDWARPEASLAALADAAHTDLLARLNARGRVRVVPNRADAEAVLQGRLSSSGTVCTLALSLSSEDDHYEFWNETFQGPPFTLPQMLERAAHAIERAFAPGSRAFREAENFPSAEVAELWLEARAAYRAFWGSSLTRSVELFERALALAPDHPLVLGWTGAALSRRRFFDVVPSEHDRGHELALRAVELAPDLPIARVALASSHMHEMRLVDAIPHYVEALRMAPGMVEQRANFARILLECGAVVPALALAKSTYDADPSFREPLEVVMRHDALSGRADFALAELRHSEGSMGSLGAVAFGRYCLWNKNRKLFEAHRARVANMEIDQHPKMISDIAQAIFAGERPVIETLLAPMRGGTRRRLAFFHQLSAEFYAAMDDWDRALDALEISSEHGLFDTFWLDRCPLFDELRGEMRFELVRKTAHGRAMEALAEIERCLAMSASIR